MSIGPFLVILWGAKDPFNKPRYLGVPTANVRAVS